MQPALCFFCNYIGTNMEPYDLKSILRFIIRDSDSLFEKCLEAASM